VAYYRISTNVEIAGELVKATVIVEKNTKTGKIFYHLMRSQTPLGLSDEEVSLRQQGLTPPMADATLSQPPADVSEGQPNCITVEPDHEVYPGSSLLKNLIQSSSLFGGNQPICISTEYG
jgi:hypothetical protein